MSIAEMLPAAHRRSDTHFTRILAGLASLTVVLGLGVALAHLVPFGGTMKAVARGLPAGAMPGPEGRPAPAVGLAPTADSSLMGYWKFDEGSGTVAYDASGNGNHGTRFGDIDWMSPGAPIGSANPYALNLFGTADYMEAPGHATLNPADEFTMMAWVYLLYPSQDQKILGHVPSGLGSGYLLGIQNGQLDPEIWDSAGTHYRFQGGSIAANIWTHLAVTWKSSGQMIGYIDGSPVYTTAASANPIGSSTVSLTLGVAPWDHNAFGVDGAIDEVRLYSRTLSVDEIRAAASSCAATPNNGGNIYLTVQQAVDAANPRGTVKLAGTCAGVPSRLDMAQTAYITKPLALSGGYTASFVEPPDPVAHPTVLDAQGLGRVITASADVSLSGLTLQNGSIEGSGGGVYAGASVTLTNVTLISNTAGLYGGGLYVAGSATLSGTFFVSNTASSYGGGLYQNDLSRPVSVTGSRFERNVATQYSGGGLFVGSSIVLSKTLLINNTAGQFGGGLYAYKPLTLTDISVVGNFAGLSGSGLYVYGGGGNSRVVNAVFARNHTNNSSGAALHLFNSDGLAGTATILHTTIASPTQDSGVAIRVPAGVANITNTIIASYTTGLDAVAGVTVTSDYNLFFQAPTSLITGSHSITGIDPAFANPVGDDYHLVSGSPAIDHGMNVGVASDLDGTLRPLGDGFDMGAYEAQSCRARVGGGPTVYATLQDAVDAANPGDTVKVSGTCSGVQSRGELSQTVYISKPLALSGGYSALFTEPPDPVGNPAVLDARGLGRVITTSAEVSLSGLTIRNGSAVGSGGGVYANASVTLTNVTVFSNTAGQSGGGLYQLGSSGRVDVADSRFERNVAVGALPNGKGGGLYAEGNVVLWGTQVLSNVAQVDGGGVYQLSQTRRVDVTNSVFERNTARGYSGGGLYAAGRAALTGTQALNNTAATQGGGLTLMNGGILSDTQVVSNTATGDGGGLFIWLSSGSLEVRGGSFERNMSAAGKGGGVCAAGAVTLTGVTVIGNAAALSGGGLWVGDSAQLSRTHLAGNTAGQHGGGLYVQGMGTDTQVVNALFDRNRAGSGQGAALYLFDSGGSGGSASILHTTIASPTLGAGAALYAAKGTVGITNTIIASYTVSIERAGGAVYQDYDLFYPASALSGTISVGAHSLTADPAFLNPPDDDYHSTPDSWSVDRGVDLGVPVDLDGNPRPRFGAPDMGAYELQIPLAADLSLTKTAHAASVTSGAEVTYTLQVSNLGPSLADTVRVTDTLPTGLVFRRFSASGWSCTQASGVVMCSLSSLPVASAPDIQLVAAVSAASGPLANSATVGAATGDLGPGNNTDTATITVNPIQVSFADGTAAVGESGGYKDILVRLSALALNTITVNYATVADTAQAGTDYTTTSGVLSFAPGEITSTIRVPIVNDAMNEAIESFWLTLSSPTMAELGSLNQLKLSIADDDALPVVQFGLPPRYLRSEAAGSALITVTLSAPSGQPVQINYATLDDSATHGLDYTEQGGVLFFSPGITQTTFNVPILDDGLDEPVESFYVQLSNPQNASVNSSGQFLRQTPGRHAVYLEDNDRVRLGFLSQVMQVVEAQRQYDVVVQLDQPPASLVSVDYYVYGNTASRDLDYLVEPTFGTLTFAAGVTRTAIPLTIIDDTLYEEYVETIQIHLLNPVNANFDPNQVDYYPDRLNGWVKILDNDKAPDFPNLDLRADALEVTQSIQDDDNQVTLVAGKRTFVRFHVHSFFDDWQSEARLDVWHYDLYRGWITDTLQPINPGGTIVVRESPHRERRDDAFLFEIPTDWTNEGTVTLVAEVNPNRVPQEMEHANNRITTQVHFHPSLVMDIVLVDVPTCAAWINTLPPPAPPYYVCVAIKWNSAEDLQRVEASVQRLFPSSKIRFSHRIYYHENHFAVSTNSVAGELVLTGLSMLREFEIQMGVVTANTRYYGLIATAWWLGTTPRMSMTRGQIGVGSAVGDFDLVAAATIANEYGATGGGETIGNYGFNIDTQDILPPDTPALKPQNYCAGMLCQGRWLGPDVTNYLASLSLTTSAAPERPAQTAAADQLLVGGFITEATHVNLQPIFVVPNMPLQPVQTGDYAIVLRDSGGAELSRHQFSPQTSTISGTSSIGFFTQWVPYIPAAARLDVEGPGGMVLTSVQAGINSPTVTLTAPTFPSGLEVLSGGLLTITWAASDPDGDALAYDLMFSADDGDTWRPLATGLVSPTLAISTSMLTAAAPGRLAIWASDGLHTAYAASDPFVVANRPPEVAILGPAGGSTVFISQTLSLRGYAADPDGSLPASQVRWVSDRDGLLGYGLDLSVTGLSAGSHTITLIAGDSSGGVASDQVQVSVITDAALIPLPEFALRAEPAELALDTSQGHTSEPLFVSNANPGWPITWTARTDIPWLNLSALSGSTPSTITVRLDRSGLAEGWHTVPITFTSSAVPGQAQIVTVSAYVEGIEYRVYLPTITKSASP